MKMKAKFSLIFFLISVKILSCTCLPQIIPQAYFENEIVGIITIKSTYGNEIVNEVGFGNRTYKAKIGFDKIYKGKEFNELTILGTTESISSGACEIQVKAGEKYLILLNKNLEGKYIVSLCSNIYRVNSNLKKYNQLFRYLDKNRIKFQDLRFLAFYDKSNDWDDINKKETSDFINTFGKKLKNKFGLYKIKIDSENNIIEVNSIKKIGLNENKILTLIKKNIKVDFISNKVPNSQYLLFLDF